MRTKKILLSILILLGTIPIIPPAHAENCNDLELIFTRGSGEIQNENRSFQEFINSLEPKLKTTTLKYKFIDLDYPAIAVNDFGIMLGAFISGGTAYEYGKSMDIGAENLKNLVNSHPCKNTKFILAGYSQGAMIISRVLNELDSEKIIYTATFGDPKLYLPEGEGFYPDACRNKNLSDYRKYVPDCHAFEGLLGSYRPYEPENFVGKLGTWCNKQDIMCSSAFNLDDHVSYVDDGLYDDASKIIFDKISKTFDFKNTLTSPHDTAILIDSTSSMSEMINKYKSEAIRLATETLSTGGRVALYDYRDLADPYQPNEHCNFETCTIELIKSELEKIEVEGGGDFPESLLSASLHVMNRLNWRYGATKSIIVLTDDGFHIPDLDGTTLLDVVKLSQSIDPVNFYIITNPESASSYKELTEQTDGKIETDFNKLSLLTDLVMNRYDSLPRVEPEDEPSDPATIKINSYNFHKTLTVNFETNAEKVLVVLNDLPLGLTTDKKIEITDLNIHQENTLRLVPIKSNHRGQSAELHFDLIPSVPNTGTVFHPYTK